MTGTSTDISERQVAWGIVAVAVAGWLLRASPLAGDGGAWAVKVDYDEGVYFSGAALFLRGLLPYRDFVFVHPPGFLLLLLPVVSLASKLGVAHAFIAARWFSTALGGANVALSATVARRAAGPLAGLVAACLYSIYPEAMAVERGVFLEPALNLACLAAAVIWLREPLTPRWAAAAGVLAGAAVAIKLWAGIWVLACLASVPAEGRIRLWVRFGLGAAAAMALTIGPIALASRQSFWADVWTFQLHRPADNLANRFTRIGEVFSSRHAAAWLLASLGVVRLVVRGLEGMRGSAASPAEGEHAHTGLARGERLVLVAYLLTLIAFFAARAFWSQYDAFLAPAEVVLAGVGVAWLWSFARGSGPIAQLGVILVLISGLTLGAARAVKVNRNARSDDLPHAAEVIQKDVPAQACVLSLEPGWGIAAGRLPERIDGEAPWVDPYARMLLDAEARGRFPTVTDAFANDASQRSFRSSAEACPYLVLGDRADWQLSSDTRAWVREHWLRRYEGRPDLWERRAP